MESNERVEALEALDSVTRERAESGRRYAVPRGYDELLGLAVGILAVAVALSNTEDGWRGAVVLAVGAGLALGLCALQVARFRRLNGTWVSGLVAGRTRLVTALAFLTEVLGIVAATVLATAGHLGWSLAVALATGAVFAGLSRAWSRRYLAELGA